MTKAQMEAQNQAKPGEKGKSRAKGPVLMTEREVTKEIKSAPAETVIKDVKERGVDFDMTPDIEKKLRKAKATDEVVAAVRRAGPKVRAQMAKMVVGPGPAGTVDIPRVQAEAFDAIKSELDADKAIALAEDFTKKYPDSALLPYIYFFAANSYQQKDDLEKVVEYTGKGLKLEPDNLACLVMRVGMLPQPQYLNSHAADRDKILQEAERDANRALQLVPQIPKLPNETDQDYQKRQTSTTSQVHGSLGMVHLELAIESLTEPDKAELAKAEQEFKTAVTTTDRPYPGDYFYMGEAYKLDDKFDDAIEAYTKAAQAGQGTMVKTFADRQIEEIKRRKAQGSAAPKP
jgi:tetratricopeptide (TPR) repeat protein